MHRIVIMSLILLSLSWALPVQAQDADVKEERRAAFREKMQDRLADIDSNGDGAIEKSEFMAQAEEKFSKMDADGDGVITPEEMKGMRDRLKGLRSGGGGEGGGLQFP